MSNVVVTNLGIQKLTEATIEKPLILEEFALGDANNNDVVLDPSKTSLVNEKFRSFVNSKYTKDNNIIVECVLRANANITEGFNLNELGVFDNEGNMIFYVALQGTYRPPSDGSTVVIEQIFNINTALQSSENIEIKVEESIFATQDALSRLENRIQELENKQTALKQASVGIDKWFNTDNRYKDQSIIKIGSKTWVLMDESNILNKETYPLLFTNTNAEEILDSEGNKTGTFKLPNTFLDGTVRHLPKGSTRLLGSYELDALQTIKGTLRVSESGGNQAFLRFRDTSGAFSTKTQRVYALDLPQSGVDLTESVALHFNSSAVVKSDDNETRMKNTAGQWYILADID